MPRVAGDIRRTGAEVREFPIVIGRRRRGGGGAGGDLGQHQPGREHIAVVLHGERCRPGGRTRCGRGQGYGLVAIRKGVVHRRDGKRRGRLIRQDRHCVGHSGLGRIAAGKVYNQIAGRAAGARNRAGRCRVHRAFRKGGRRGAHRQGARRSDRAEATVTGRADVGRAARRGEGAESGPGGAGVERSGRPARGIPNQRLGPTATSGRNTSMPPDRRAVVGSCEAARRVTQVGHFSVGRVVKRDGVVHPQPRSARAGEHLHAGRNAPLRPKRCCCRRGKNHRLAGRDRRTGGDCNRDRRRARAVRPLESADRDRRGTDVGELPEIRQTIGLNFGDKQIAVRVGGGQQGAAGGGERCNPSTQLG